MLPSSSKLDNLTVKPNRDVVMLMCDSHKDFLSASCVIKCAERSEAHIGAQSLNGAADKALAASVLHSGLILLGIGIVLPVLLNCTRWR